MNLPEIDLSSLPDLDILTGMFGSLAQDFRSTYSDDTIIDIMTFLYEVVPPSNML